MIKLSHTIPFFTRCSLQLLGAYVQIPLRTIVSLISYLGGRILLISFINEVQFLSLKKSFLFFLSFFISFYFYEKHTFIEKLKRKQEWHTKKTT